MAKAVEAFRTISEVADDLGIHKHVLRFWEVKFSQIRPMKRGGGRRYYRPEDMELLRGIRRLLHKDGYTIKGVQKILREQGVEAVKERARDEGEPAEAVAAPTASAAPPPPTPPLRTKRGAASGKPLGREAKAVLTAIIAELLQCREILADQGSSKAAEMRKTERRPRRSA